MHGCACARALAVIVLLLSYGAVGARQPAVRVALPLPVRAQDLAGALDIQSVDRSQILIDVVRLVFDVPDGQSAEDAALRARLVTALRTRGEATDTVPLPLDPSIWRETILKRNVPDAELVAAILADRSTALLYHGLVALDDETLGWLGPDRETLAQLRRNAGAFAAFGGSVRVRAGRVAVPGGPEAEPLWKAVVGADPAIPAAFVQKLFEKSHGRLAWFYDTVAHLPAPQQRLALGGTGQPGARIDRMRDLLETFESCATEWRVVERPFTRPTVDPALVLSLLAATDDGTLVGPFQRRIWERVFRDDAIDVTFEETARDQIGDGGTVVDPSWLIRRIVMVPSGAGRRRLETALFAQRVFAQPGADPAGVTTALRGFAAFPTLLLTLERMRLTDPALLADAAKRAAAIGNIGSVDTRRMVYAQFQGTIGLLARASAARGLDPGAVRALVSSLVRVEVSGEGYEGRLAAWLRSTLLTALHGGEQNGSSSAEEEVIAAIAGVRPDRGAPPSVEWEGAKYTVDPQQAEAQRLKRVRERQMRLLPREVDASLDARIEAALRRADGGERRDEAGLARALASMLYAAHLGSPDGAPLMAGDVADRHDFGIVDVVGTPRAGKAWRLPVEQYGSPAGWRVVGSLLGLENGMGRLSLRRLDLSDMPPAPALSTNERQTATLTAALLNPAAMTNEAMAEIVAAIGRGRARVNALGGDRAEFERVAAEAGFSPWRREALGWALAHDRAAVPSRFSLVDLLWLGTPKLAPAVLDEWGAATVLLDGCLCVRMPRPEPWEMRAGRPATGQLATRGADVTLRVAEVVSELGLPASIVPGVVAFAMQDVIDQAHPSHFDDWPAFERAARDIPRDRIVDYVAALAAGGPLRPVQQAGQSH